MTTQQSTKQANQQATELTAEQAAAAAAAAANQQATQQANQLAAEQAIRQRRDASMRQATADQSLSLLDTLADFRMLFPTVTEVTEIVVNNGGLKATGKETQNTTLLLYIAMLGADTFNALYDSTNLTQADTVNLTPTERGHKCARHALSVYRAMVVVDKYAACIPATAKFTRTSTVQPA